MNGTDSIIIFATVVSLIVGGILTFRAVFKYLDWRDGDDKALWNFIALCCGGASGIFFFMGGIGVFTGPWALIELSFTLGTLLALAGLGLTFTSVLMKWLDTE